MANNDSIVPIRGRVTIIANEAEINETDETGRKLLYIVYDLATRQLLLSPVQFASNSIVNPEFYRRPRMKNQEEN